jgi:hypothetical protein
MNKLCKVKKYSIEKGNKGQRQLFRVKRGFGLEMAIAGKNWT